jgi:hypothetical protein
MRKSKDVTSYNKTKKEIFKELNKEDEANIESLDHLEESLGEAKEKSRNMHSESYLQLPYQETRATTGVTGVSHATTFKHIEDIMESNINAKEWKKECERVNKRLMLPLQVINEGDELQDFYTRKDKVIQHLEQVN